VPTLPLPPCRVPGCPNLQSERRRGYCTEHEHIGDQVRQRGRYRGSARARGYDRRYERTRAWVLAQEPFCRRCREKGRLTFATQTHHIVPLSEGGTNEASNLMPVCDSCHQELHGGP
jgi:5-methylcytosine-specific restriction protein A